jgi:hypothetical protein
MLPKGAAKKPNEYGHAQGCPLNKKRKRFVADAQERRNLRFFQEEVNNILRDLRGGFGFRLAIEDDHLVVLSDRLTLPSGYRWLATGDFGRTGLIALDMYEL